MSHRSRPAWACLTTLGLLTLPLPAFAQDPTPAPEDVQICGGQVNWLGGDQDGSDITASTDPLSAQAAVTGHAPSLFAFRVAAGSQAIRAEASAENGDPAIALLTEDGDVIAENDDTPVSLNSSLETTVGPGIYCLALSSVGAAPMTAEVQISHPDQPALLGAEAQGLAGMNAITACTADTTALPLTEGALDERLDQGTVSVSHDSAQIGHYRFTLGQPTSLSLRAASNQHDPAMRLFDAQGNLVAENDDTDGLNARLDFLTPLAPGDYCIGVAALSPQPGEISLTADALDAETFLRDAYRRGELNPPADGSYPVQDIDLTTTKQTVVLHDGAAQWLGFDLDQPTVVVISAIGRLVGADPKLVLFAPNGTLAGENDDMDGSTDSRLGPVLLQPGRHHLGVIDISRNDSAAGAVRPIGLVFERYLRAD